MRHIVSTTIGVAATVLALSVGRVAIADEAPSATDAASAEVLFKKARGLMDEGRTEEACAAFDASYQFDPAPGTLLNIGACNRSLGRTATAWSQFVEAERLLRRRGDTRRADFAKGEAAALEAGLAHLVLEAASRPPGLTIARDGIETRVGSLGTSLPIDPGRHEIVAKATGYATYKGFVTVAPGKEIHFEIPTLRVAPSSPQAENLGARRRLQRTLGWAVGGMGVGTLALGGVFVGLVAERKSAADPHCPSKRCDAFGQAAIDRGNTYANVANVLLPTGAVFTAAGIIVLVTAPREPVADAPSTTKAASPVTFRITPVVAPTVAYLGIDGAF